MISGKNLKRLLGLEFTFNDDSGKKVIRVGFNIWPLIQPYHNTDVPNLF